MKRVARFLWQSVSRLAIVACLVVAALGGIAQVAMFIGERPWLLLTGLGLAGVAMLWVFVELLWEFLNFMWAQSAEEPDAR